MRAAIGGGGAAAPHTTHRGVHAICQLHQVLLLIDKTQSERVTTSGTSAVASAPSALRTDPGRCRVPAGHAPYAPDAGETLRHHTAAPSGAAARQRRCQGGRRPAAAAAVAWTGELAFLLPRLLPFFAAQEKPYRTGSAGMCGMCGNRFACVRVRNPY
jgi:hypothetical protein